MFDHDKISANKFGGNTNPIIALCAGIAKNTFKSVIDVAEFRWDGQIDTNIEDLMPGLQSTQIYRQTLKK